MNFQNNSKRKYIRLIKRGLTDVSAYFKDWIAITNAKDNKIETYTLVTILNAINIPKDKNGDKMSREDFLKDSFDFISLIASKGATLNIKELSKQLFGEDNPDTISDYAEEHQMSIDTEFKPDGRVLVRLHKVSARTNGITLNFERILFQKKVIQIDKKNPNLIKIESKELADSVRQSMHEE